MSENRHNTAGVIRIVGLGIRGPKQLTLEAVAHLQSTAQVFFFRTPELDEVWLTKRLGVAQAEDIRPLYRDGDRDVSNYRRIVRRVTAGAEEYSDVALLMPGHPRVGVSLVEPIQTWASARGVRVRVVDGTSSFDAMITDLEALSQ